jgi:uncharacterized protein YkwD
LGAADSTANFGPAGYVGNNVGETMAYDYDAEGTVQAWVASPGHFANMVNPSFTDTRVGAAVGPDGTLTITATFGSGGAC